MPTSASCPAADPRAGAVARGFSLLELLIVLALLGLVSALVAPRLQRTYEAIASSGDRAEVYRQLERLPRLARLAGRAIVVPEGGAGALAAELALPEGWVVSPLEPLRIEANGLCRGGRVRILGAGTEEDVALTAPTCGVAHAP